MLVSFTVHGARLTMSNLTLVKPWLAIRRPHWMASMWWVSSGGDICNIKVPPPVAKPPYPRHPLPTNLASEHRPEPVPPIPHCLMADVDPAIEQQFFHVPQTERETHVNHDDEADLLGRRVETAERGGRFCSGFAAHLRPLTDCHIGLAVPPPQRLRGP